MRRKSSMLTTRGESSRAIALLVSTFELPLCTAHYILAHPFSAHSRWTFDMARNRIFPAIALHYGACFSLCDYFLLANVLPPGAPKEQRSHMLGLFLLSPWNGAGNGWPIS